MNDPDLPLTRFHPTYLKFNLIKRWKCKKKSLYLKARVRETKRHIERKGFPLLVCFPSSHGNWSWTILWWAPDHISWGLHHKWSSWGLSWEWHTCQLYSLKAKHWPLSYVLSKNVEIVLQIRRKAGKNLLKINSKYCLLWEEAFHPHVRSFGVHWHSVTSI